MTGQDLRAALVRLYGEGSDYHLVEAAHSDLGAPKSGLYKALRGEPIAVKVPLETVLRVKGAFG
ncbi:hypothetical protein J2850_004277 [Azospirillum picis]|uniref:Uncharacterized protein n=1 Tax=Azospirillum picis TaxID=488438 RepID=A0ABU0MPI9_9PROT|nr:hypothetical protein [Azospirillum picis]MDQ0535388.1 hypothetical protein [Azospirillum picis]